MINRGRASLRESSFIQVNLRECALVVDLEFKGMVTLKTGLSPS